MWTLSENYLEVVERNWIFYGYGTKHYKLKKLLYGLKKHLTALNQRTFSHISTRASAAKDNLQALQQTILHSGIMADNYKNVRKTAELLLEAERLFIAQKAKCKFLREGDRCSKFFHDLIKRNNKKNSTLAIQKSDGTTCTNPTEISSTFVDHFRNILGIKVDRLSVSTDILSGPLISLSEYSNLSAPVELDEIKDFLQGNDKTNHQVQMASGPFSSKQPGLLLVITYQRLFVNFSQLDVF